MRKNSRAGAFWLLDIGGAAVFAWGLAAAVAALIDGLPLLVGVAAMLGGGAIRALSGFAAQSLAIREAQRSVAPVRAQLHRRLLGEVLHRPIPIGESAAIAIDHVDRIEAHAARFLPVRQAAALGPLLVAGCVALASPIAAAILIGTLIPFVLGMILAGTMARRAADAQLRALEQLSDLFVERLRSLAMIRHFGAGERITRQIGAATQGVATRTLAVLRIAFLSSAVLEFFAALSVALVAVYCGFSLLGILPFPVPETLTFREALFALALAPEFYLPMRRLAAAYHEKQLGEAAHAVIDPLCAAPPAPPAAHAAFVGIEVTDLVIAWPGARIGPVSFRLGNTGMVALTGPTGSGKTSVLAACAGQVAASEGRVSAPLMTNIAWAAQRPLVVPGTLRDNLALARPEAGEREILEICDRVGLGPLLAARGGLDLTLDHRAAGLSGGELRRLGLARALLSRRPLLLCDEPTADLDAASAAQITALLTELAKTHAILVATHDMVLAAHAQAEVRL
jgi:ATP-binding cassette, subfamily C, bacterial CydD